MVSFNSHIQTIILCVATLLTGLLAGVFFTWANAVTTGIGRLNDTNYLRAFQEMNRTILNPLFYIIFAGPLVLSFIAAFFYRDRPIVLWILIAVIAIYFIGVFLITISGNIPLNEMLDKTNLEDFDLNNAKNLRDKFEAKWNSLHLIRTIASLTSFLLLILACLFKDNNI
ncbi:anthrone oxygenase family protein [Aquimarina sediminis]|uniref:anthrone oxygenase family protein n=1 Tax=Aquimarina sediminis TaxID=2070536 RepID=UPI000CA025C5|nr:anthrone oxygenase family protein [Aquimarina sediminis]